MGQKPLIYAFVSRGTVVLSEYTEFSGNFNSIAFQCLQKLPASNNKFTYNCDGHTFNYLVDNGYSEFLLTFSLLVPDLLFLFSSSDLYLPWLTDCLCYCAAYCVVADESAGRQVPMAFLERIKEDFMSKYGSGKATTATANSLNKEFGPKLKEHMQYCVDHPEEISKLAKVKAQVSEVKGVMMENIEKVLDRGEKIELLVDKTENLHQQVSDIQLPDASAVLGVL
ncbi:Putative vesicle-associated membrane protein 726 [Linum perenne]